MSKPAADFRRNFDLVQMIERSIHGGKVLLHHGFAAPAIGLLNGVLDGGNGFLARQHSADGEEAGLHHGVDAAAHAGVFRHLDGVDHEEAQLLLDDLPLGGARHHVPDLVWSVGAVEQENGAGFGGLEHVIAARGT